MANGKWLKPETKKNNFTRHAVNKKWQTDSKLGSYIAAKGPVKRNRVRIALEL